MGGISDESNRSQVNECGRSSRRDISFNTRKKERKEKLVNAFRQAENLIDSRKDLISGVGSLFNKDSLTVEELKGFASNPENINSLDLKKTTDLLRIANAMRQDKTPDKLTIEEFVNFYTK
jgi:hypothetical protein